MACNSVAILSSPAAKTTTTATGDVRREPTGLPRKSLSANDLCSGSSLWRSYSDNHISYSMNRIRASSTQPNLRYSRSHGVLPIQISTSITSKHLQSVIFDLETSRDKSLANGEDEAMVDEEQQRKEIKRANWIERLLEIRSRWSKRRQTTTNFYEEEEEEDFECNIASDEGGCRVSYGSEDEEDDEAEYDRESFIKLLSKVSLPDTKRFSQLAFLSNMAYVIPTIRGEDLRRVLGLRFVTSSIEKKAEAAAIKGKFEQDSTRVPVGDDDAPNDSPNGKTDMIHPTVAYDIAASAASYVQSQAKDIFTLGHEEQVDGRKVGRCTTEEKMEDRVYNSEAAVYMAASTMTAVVAAGEREKQEAARDLQSLHSSPCEWFVCDDYSTYTRHFVIQGSDSLASWQANLLFEPTKFEGTEGLVHRGIYEVAKGLYDQFLPEIIRHMDRYGVGAKFQFTGHSLGGSLALLVNLMLLTRKVLDPHHLWPVVTFGSPFIFCGGQKILKQLGLDEDHIHCVIMHRDIVPRAFSCSYPGQIAVLLKRLNKSFRSHPCLIRNKLLYSPMGKLFILQPDEKTSPPHPLLPIGCESALYALDKTKCGFSRSAVRAFINRPHPLHTLSYPSAYGSQGTILRDHHSSNYLKVVNEVLRVHRKVPKMVTGRETMEESQLWPLLISHSLHSWSHESHFDGGKINGKEVVTGV